MDLVDRVALITGGRRMGAEVAAALAGRGMHVALAYNRSRAEADGAADAVRASGRQAFLIQADLGHATNCREAVDAAAAALGRLDALLNLASVYRRLPFEETDEAAWDAVMRVDLKAAFLCARAAVPHMRRGGGGRIVNFSDWVAVSGRPRYTGYLPYYVAKHAVVGLTEALALELAPEILVNAIAPGPILAPDGITTDEYRAVERATPVGRWGGPAEIAKAAVFLLETDFVTGETVRVDGGRHVR